jgi:hypothetical protein
MRTNHPSTTRTGALRRTERGLLYSIPAAPVDAETSSRLRHYTRKANTERCCGSDLVMLCYVDVRVSDLGPWRFHRIQ